MNEDNAIIEFDILEGIAHQAVEYPNESKEIGDGVKAQTELCRKFPKQQHQQLYERLTCWDKPMNPLLVDYFLKFLQDFSTIKMALEPLRDHGLCFELALVGGCVRDSLLGNRHGVKDLDILLSYTQQDIDIHLLQEDVVNKSLGVPHDWQWQEQSSLSQKFFDIVHFLLKQHVEIEKDYPQKGMVLQEDFQTHFNGYLIVEQRLQGVIKINDSSLHYPIDILFSNLGSWDFISLFDFDICQCAINMKDIQQGLHAVHKMLQSILCTSAFLEDILEQKLTLRTINRAHLWEIDASLEKHLPRLQSKYPHHQLNIIVDDREEITKWWSAYQLKQVLAPVAHEQASSRRIKI